MSIAKSLLQREVYGSSRLPRSFSKEKLLHNLVSREIQWSDDRYDDSIPFVLQYSREKLDGNLALCADEAGFVSLIDTRKCFEWEEDDCFIRTRWASHANAVFDASWLDSSEKLVTASGDQTLKVWDVETESVLFHLKGHIGSVKAVNPSALDPSILVSGGRDGSVKLWDTRVETINGATSAVISIERAHIPELMLRTNKRRRILTGKPTSSVTAVKFLKNNHLIASAGASDGLMKVWDLRHLNSKDFDKKKTIKTFASISPCEAEGCRRSHGITSLDVSPCGSRILISSCDQKIHVYNTWDTPYQREFTLSGHLNKSFYVKAKFCPQGDFIASGSSDWGVYFWKIPRFNRPVSPPFFYQSHVGEVNGLDWSPTEFGKLITSSDDSSVRVWAMGQDNRNIEQSPGVIHLEPRQEEASMIEDSLTPPSSDNAPCVTTGFPTPPERRPRALRTCTLTEMWGNSNSSSSQEENL